MQLEKSLRDYLERDVDEHYYLTKKQIGQIRNWKSHQNPLDNILHDDSKCPTITTRVAETDAGGISASTIVYGGEIRYDEGVRTFKNGCMGALRAERNGEKVIIAKQNEMDDVRIRKLTPKECWRIMGIDDVDFEKAKEVNSNSQLYKQAGNAIVVDVFEVILRQLIDTE